MYCMIRAISRAAQPAAARIIANGAVAQRVLTAAVPSCCRHPTARHWSCAYTASSPGAHFKPLGPGESGLTVPSAARAPVDPRAGALGARLKLATLTEINRAMVQKGQAAVFRRYCETAVY